LRVAVYQHSERSAVGIEHVVRPICRSAHLSCGETADWIWMPFGVMSRVGPGIHVLDEVHVPEGEGAVPAWFLAFFSIFAALFSIGK